MVAHQDGRTNSLDASLGHDRPLFVHSQGMPWMSCEWLGDVVFATVYRIGGLRGLEALLMVLASAVILALYAFATLRSGNSKAGFVAAPCSHLANASFICVRRCWDICS